MCCTEVGNPVRGQRSHTWRMLGGRVMSRKIKPRNSSRLPSMTRMAPQDPPMVVMTEPSSTREIRHDLDARLDPATVRTLDPAQPCPQPGRTELYWPNAPSHTGPMSLVMGHRRLRRARTPQCDPLLGRKNGALASR